jgi:hypothetical protein
MDAPEAAEGETADDDGQDIVLNEQREGAKRQARHEPDPPAPLPPLVLHLDDQGMTDADAQEYGRADKDATVIHTDLLGCKYRQKERDFLGQNESGLGLFLHPVHLSNNCYLWIRFPNDLAR